MKKVHSLSDLSWWDGPHNVGPDDLDKFFCHHQQDSKRRIYMDEVESITIDEFRFNKLKEM